MCVCFGHEHAHTHKYTSTPIADAAALCMCSNWFAYANSNFIPSNDLRVNRQVCLPRVQQEACTLKTSSTPVQQPHVPPLIPILHTGPSVGPCQHLSAPCAASHSNSSHRPTCWCLSDPKHCPTASLSVSSCQIPSTAQLPPHLLAPVSICQTPWHCPFSFHTQSLA